MSFELKKLAFSLSLLLACMSVTWSQEDSLQYLVLEEVKVQATRIEMPAVKQPFSVATYQAGTLQETRQQLSLQEYLWQVPGLFSMNANNYAQDLRISIRGFGARAAFGIRGVKIVVDGIPETTPDGQGQIDNLNIGIIDRIEVLKGPSSALYGNAAGGVIQIFTKKDFTKNYLTAGLTYGSFDMQQYQFGGGFGQNKTKVIFQGTHTRTDGYREHARVENTNVNARLFHTFSERSKLSFQLNYTDSPVGEDPGGIKQVAVEEDRQQARDLNLLLDADEAVQQLKVGGQFTHQIDETKSLQFYGFYSNRDFIGRIPVEFNGWIDLQRDYYGQGGHFTYQKPLAKSQNTLMVGYEWANQADRRQRYGNLMGKQGDLRLNQTESFAGLGLYVLNHYEVDRWLFSAGLRYNVNALEAEDHKLDDGDDSGKRDLLALNPSIGINVEMAEHLHFYGSYRSSFETPALSELSANPAGEAGFNADLKSQTAHNYEIGFKGLLTDKLDFDLTIFHIDTQNDLVPYELEAFPGRDFFRNAGSTRRDGLEMWLRYAFSTKLTLRGSYTYSDFQYVNYQLGNEDFGGNLLPGIPPHLFALLLAYQNDSGLNLRLQHRASAAFYANDANTETARESAAQVTDLSLSYRFAREWGAVVPFCGVNNLFDTAYSDNVRINAFGERYYEPAAGVNYYGGVRFKFGG